MALTYCPQTCYAMETGPDDTTGGDTMPKIVDEQMREATRARIIGVAASEFARLGFDQANINVIAELAGIGKGTIYLYFENKRDLFLAMLRSIANTQLSAIRAALAPE